MAKYSFLDFNYTDPKDEQQKTFVDVSLKDPEGKEPKSVKLPELSDDEYYEVDVKSDDIEDGKIR